MNTLAKLLNTYAGRDSAIRTVSYLSLYLSGHTTGSLSHKFKTIGEELSYCRIILRLFDDLPMLRFTWTYGLGKEEKGFLMRLLGVLKNIVDQIYYPVEHIAWAADMQLVRAKSSLWWTTGSVLWAISSYLSVVRSLLMMSFLQRKTYGLKNVTVHENIVKEQLELLLSAFKDTANVIIAINYLPTGSLLWAGKLNMRQIGLFGLISSMLRWLMLFRSIKNESNKTVV